MELGVHAQIEPYLRFKYVSSVFYVCYAGNIWRKDILFGMYFTSTPCMYSSTMHFINILISHIKKKKPLKQNSILVFRKHIHKHFV